MGLAEAEMETPFRSTGGMITDDHTHAELIHGHQGPGEVGLPVHHHHHPVAEDEPLEFELTFGLDSRYVSEGRDNLPDDSGISWVSAVTHWHALGGSVFGELLGIAAWEGGYDEVNVAAGYEWQWGPLELALAGNYLWFPDDGEDDVEVGGAVEWVHESGLGVLAAAYWSFEAEGWFGEAAVFYECPLSESIALIPSVFLGVNQGYVEDEHDGFNHLGIQLEGIVQVSEQLELVVYASYLEPLDREDGESLRDLFWGGGAAIWRF